MKQQVLEAKLARVEAIARKALSEDGKAAALVDILKIVQKRAYA